MIIILILGDVINVCFGNIIVVSVIDLNCIVVICCNLVIGGFDGDLLMMLGFII